MMTFNAEKRKFTLVELLVVIAIISILAGMLLPALENALESAHTISCLNKLKNLGITMSMYTDDNNSIYPHHYNGWYPISSGQGGIWVRALGMNYFDMPLDWQTWPQTEHIFICPTSVDLDEIYTVSFGGQTGWATSYGMNQVYSYQATSQIKNPGETLLLTDSDQRYAVYKPWWPDRHSFRHSGNCGALYGDSHAGVFDVGEDIDDIWTND